MGRNKETKTIQNKKCKLQRRGERGLPVAEELENNESPWQQTGSPRIHVVTDTERDTKKMDEHN
jgi:hypothetical protein